jgi:hypothetical protein
VSAAVTVPAVGLDTNLLVGAGQIVTWLLIFRSMSVARGAKDSVNENGIKELTGAIERLTKIVESLEEWRRTHQREDDERWFRGDENQKRLSSDCVEMARILEHLRAEIINVARNEHDTVREVGANTHPRR